MRDRAPGEDGLTDGQIRLIAAGITVGWVGLSILVAVNTTSINGVTPEQNHLINIESVPTHIPGRPWAYNDGDDLKPPKYLPRIVVDRRP